MLLSQQWQEGLALHLLPCYLLLHTVAPPHMHATSTQTPTSCNLPPPSPANNKTKNKQAKVLQEIRIDRLDLGTRPPRVDCFKSYETTEDELIVEVGRRCLHAVHVHVLPGICCTVVGLLLFERPWQATGSRALPHAGSAGRGAVVQLPQHRRPRCRAPPTGRTHPPQTPAFWGGDMRMRVTAVVKAGARTIDVPVDVANIQVGGTPDLARGGSRAVGSNAISSACRPCASNAVPLLLSSA